MKKKIIIIFITLSFLLSGCSLDGWDALGIIDGVVSTATSDNNSGSTPIPTKSPETIDKENKVTELMEQENYGYDLAYGVKLSGKDRYKIELIDFDRMVKTTIESRAESKSASIKSHYIGGSKDSAWYVLDTKTKEKLSYESYFRINDSGEKVVIEEFKIQDNGEEKIIATRNIRDLGECAERLKDFLFAYDYNTLERQYDQLYPREE